MSRKAPFAMATFFRSETSAVNGLPNNTLGRNYGDILNFQIKYSALPSVTIQNAPIVFLPCEIDIYIERSPA